MKSEQLKKRIVGEFSAEAEASYRSQCHGGRHPRRSNGRHQAGERADQDGRGDAAQPRLGGDHDGPALRADVHGRCRGAGHDADDAADGRDQDRLGEELCPWLVVAPRGRRRPISERRSRTEMIMMLATPTAPTISATTPSPRKRLLNAAATAARAVSTSDGWLTFAS
jgi:hypothetical protein